MKTTATSADGSQRMCPLCGRLMDVATCPEDGQATVRANSQGFARIGTVVGDRYRLTELLGRGGFGDVYKAFHIGTHESVALKILRPDLGGEASAIERFTAEARMSAQLHHPNTVRVFDFGTTPDGHLYLAMEFLDGESLEILLEAEGCLPPRRTVHLCLQVLKSLAEAHGKHIVHRDLKPDNIFVVTLAGEKDFVRVIDFGIAKFLGDSQQLTVSGAILGTPHYMSPEQIRGEVLDPRADLYGLGVVLYRCLTGQFPCVGDNQFGILAAHLTEAPPPMERAGVTVDLALEAVVMRALQKARADRYPDAEAMRQALEAWQASAPPDPVIHSDTQAMDTLPTHAAASSPAAPTVQPQPHALPQDETATQALDVLVLPPERPPVPERSVQPARGPSRPSVVQAPTAVPVPAQPASVGMPPAGPLGPVVMPAPPQDSTRVGLDIVTEPPIRGPEAPAPKSLGATAGARRPSGIERRVAVPEPVPVGRHAPGAEAKGRKGLQRRTGRVPEPVRSETEETATRAMSIVTVAEHATERAGPGMAPRPAKSWLAVGIVSLLLLGGGLGVLLALRARDSARGVPPAAPVAAVRSAPASVDPVAAAVPVEVPVVAKAVAAPPPAAITSPPASATTTVAPPAAVALPVPATPLAPASAAVPAPVAPSGDRSAPRKHDKPGCSAPEGSADWCRTCPEAARLTSHSRWFCACRDAKGDTSGLPYYCACRFPAESHATGSAGWCTCHAGDPACD